MAKLQGKVALISGTGGGLGRVAALLFAKEGAKVVGCDVNSAEAEETLRMVRDAGGDMLSLTADLSSEEDTKRWVDAAVSAYGGIDILYNNAGAGKYGPFGQLPIEHWRYSMQNTLDVVYLPTKAVWPHLITRGGGVIINVGSVLSSRGTDFPMSTQGAAKGAITALTVHLAIEGGPHGIRVNTLSPGLIRTPATDKYLLDPSNPVNRQVECSPLGRIGQPEDIAPVALFLASDDSRFITGTTILVDGGQSLGIGMKFPRRR